MDATNGEIRYSYSAFTSPLGNNEKLISENELQSGNKAFETLKILLLFLEQVFIMIQKHVSQKARKGRQYLKDSFMVQLFLLLFVAFLLYSNAALYPSANYFGRELLPPLDDGPTGIFNNDSPGNTNYTLISKRLYYCPNNNKGVEKLIDALLLEYPSIEAVGAETPEDINFLYEQNLFDTWASLQFDLNDDQINNDDLITSQTQPSTVSYTILITPTNWNSPLPIYNYSSPSSIYNKQSTPADLFWSTGYMTLQNFVAEYLTRQYNNSAAAANFTVDTYFQRYPESPLYANKPEVNIATARNGIWKWIGGTILAICLFLPILSLSTEVVRERQYMMKDLLEISGLMNISYWFSYLIMMFIFQLATMAFILGLLLGLGIFDHSRLAPYASLISCYCLGCSSFALFFGFLVPRSEYYGLPVFISTVAITVCSAFLAAADNISHSAKLFFCFLSPSIGITMGVIDIESYLFSNGGSMDYDFVNDNKQYPSLNSINAVIIVSAIFYFSLCLIFPLDWLFEARTGNELVANSLLGEIEYPCDLEEESSEQSKGGKYLLQVDHLCCVYPDGTNAVKDMNFSIKEGEVLSFLGANGAGKSTTMKMLCGTLEATFGDAKVNGYSIRNQKIYARRNLGIAMQQDVIWDDVNVEDHLMLFGRLRGLHGLKLRDNVRDMIESLGFPEKSKSLAGTLSGGQKRRLCVGLSMVGGNHVVYLDEPTAGLDPVSRRQLWELVERNRKGRAILLTTHFMDEADVLGDRIAIVKEGRLRALGSSKFLKNRFGLGYLLRMSMRENAPVASVKEVVARYIPEVSIASAAGTELSLRLPRDAISSFPTVFEILENDSPALGILSYGIETTTLEEVFMRIVNEDNEQLLQSHSDANRLLTAPAEERDKNKLQLEARDQKRAPITKDQIKALLIKGRDPNANAARCIDSNLQVWVMVHKRFYQFVRSRGQWAFGIVCPILLAILAGLVLNTMETNLLAPTTAPTESSFTTFIPTFVAAPSAEASYEYGELAFGSVFNSSSIYVGGTYGELYSSVDSVSTSLSGDASQAGIAFDSLTNYTIMYNATFPVNFAGAVQSVLNAAVSNATNNLLTIEQNYNQLPYTKIGGQLNSAFFLALLIALTIGSFGAGISIVVSGERISLVKHQQLASGASNYAYWMGNFLFDFTVIFANVLIFLMILGFFMPSTYFGSNYGYLVITGVFVVATVIFRFYICSYFIADVRLAQSIYFYGSLAVAFFLVDIFFNTLFIQGQGNINNVGVRSASYVFAFLDATFGWFLLIVYTNNFCGILTQNPTAGSILSNSIGGGLLEMIVLSMLFYGGVFVLFSENLLWNMVKRVVNLNSAEYLTITNTPSSPSAATANSMNPVIGQPAAAAAAVASAAVSSKLRLDEKAVQERATGTKDADVIIERNKVDSIVESGKLNPTESAIFIHNLRKVYYARGSVPAKVAVKGVSVSIPQGEIFGLLGANGAGKTTLLKMVSGQEDPTSGFALINGFNVVGNRSKAQYSMGLCPQFDTLVERLSVSENLFFFGRLKGLSGRNLSDVVEAFMAALNIKRYEHKLIQQLSGGNRRKVSLAVALMGAPPTVYLDEPSTGLDPVASRLMWRLLTKISEARTSAIVLTTHNMLECEAVCNRVCIMKLGEMVCLGNSQHLRSTHGTGFHLELMLKSPETLEAAQFFVVNTFPATSLIEHQGNLLNFEVPRSSIDRLSAAFKVLEANKERLGIEDYVLSQSTLEQVFLKQIRPNESDARNQEDQANIDQKTPFLRDYVTAYFFWFLALVLPGLHHFYLGNKLRGLKYLFSFNEVYAGWFLDLFELHVLVQKSVQEYGHVRHVFCCNCLLDCCRSLSRNCCCCCKCCCCCCCRSAPNTPVIAATATAQERELTSQDQQKQHQQEERYRSESMNIV